LHGVARRAQSLQIAVAREQSVIVTEGYLMVHLSTWLATSEIVDIGAYWLLGYNLRAQSETPNAEVVVFVAGH
jgi:hypothetical protein